MLTLEILDRTINERLRKAVVIAGYIPDVTLFVGNAAGYKAAKDALRATVQLIEVFGEGSAEARDELTVNKIVITRKTGNPGSIGGFPSTKYESNGLTGTAERFTKYFYPHKSRDVHYEIRAITNTAKYERICEELIQDTFGERGYVIPVNPVTKADLTTEPRFLFVWDDCYDVSTTDLIEKVYKFHAKDVWITKLKIVDGYSLNSIMPLLEIVADVNVEGSQPTSPVENLPDDSTPCDVDGDIYSGGDPNSQYLEEITGGTP